MVGALPQPWKRDRKHAHRYERHTLPEVRRSYQKPVARKRSIVRVYAGNPVRCGHRLRRRIQVTGTGLLRTKASTIRRVCDSEWCRVFEIENPHETALVEIKLGRSYPLQTKRHLTVSAINNPDARCIALDFMIDTDAVKVEGRITLEDREQISRLAAALAEFLKET